MTLKQSFWLTILLKALSWLAKNAAVDLYSSPVPVGTRLGGHDVSQVKDSFLIIDVRLAGRIIVLGYFQYT
jgi:hypothetical protein